MHHISVPWICHIWRDFSDKNRENSIIDLEKVLEKGHFIHINFNNIERSLFIKFWRLSLYDIYQDESLYDLENKKLEKELTAQDLSSRKKKSMLQKKENLQNAMEEHGKIILENSKHLLPFYEKWIANDNEENILEFIQCCIVPRVIFSPSDAIFATHFIFYGFNIDYILRLLDCFMKSNILNTLLFSATISEAGNLGIFIETFLLTLEKKRQADELSDIQKRNLYNINTSMIDQIIDLLQEKNYMSIRNGIEFMKHVSNVFPVIDAQVELLIAALEHNLTSEEREDIKLPINALIGHLKARLRKQHIPLIEFCKLNEEEEKVKEEHDAEQVEIDEYVRIIENEKKQTELRRKLELNKKNREFGAERNKPDTEGTNHENDVDDIYQEGEKDSRPRELNWSLGRVFRSMSEMIYHLKMNNIKEVTNTIKDDKMSNTVANCMGSTMPTDEFRNIVYSTVKDFYKSLIRYDNNPEFVSRLAEIREACNLLSQKPSETIADMYAEDSERATPNISRYNATAPLVKSAASRTKIASKPSNDLYGTTRNDSKSVGRDETRFNRSGDRYKKIDKVSHGSKQHPYQSRQQLNGPDRQQGYNRNNNTDNNVRNVKRELPTGPEGSTTNKKPRNDTGNFKKNARYTPKSQDEQLYQKDSRNNNANNDDRGRYKSSFNKSKSSTNVTKKFGSAPPKPHLPQGPRNQSSSGSRYQK